jgi:hypothetical protein
MKRLRGLLIFALVLISTVLLSNAKSFAAEVQYTNNVIPAMTSNTSPSGKAIASSVYIHTDYNLSAWKAFDHETNPSLNGWISAEGKVNGWLEYDFSKDKCITKYTIVNRTVDQDIRGTMAQLPKSWTFEAYDEETMDWVILDTRTNITDWSYKSKKEFSFSNNTLYKNYRINITANCGYSYTSLGELEMMETVSAPTNLKALGENGKVQLSWNPVINSSNYIIKRGITPGGSYDKITPYEPVVTGSSISFIDKDITPGTTYYYVISTVVSGTESSNSNEASATPKEVITTPDHTGNTATLILTMTNGDDKVYNVSHAELDVFLNWYGNRSNGDGRAYYTFTKTVSIAPYLSVKEYVSFDKISSFEVKEYNQ